MNEPLPVEPVQWTSAPSFHERLCRLKRCGLPAGIALFVLVPFLRLLLFKPTEINLPYLAGQVFFTVLFVLYVLAACSTQLISYRWGIASVTLIAGAICLLIE